MKNKVLAINPGSTSTKIAMFADGEQLWVKSIEHSLEELGKYDTINDQLDMRYELVMKGIAENGDSLSDLIATVGRGGPFAYVKRGAYEVNEKMLDMVTNRPLAQHASSLGAGIAWKIAQSQGIKAYIYDAVTADEMIPVVRITGLKELERHGRGHNLNQRAAALTACKNRGLSYHDATLIVAHLGGGITISLHHNGRVIDVISDDEGPFSPERAGRVRWLEFIELCFSGKFDKKNMFKHVQRGGGLISHFGTADTREIERRANEGDEQAALVYEAMALNVARGIAELAVVVDGAIDCVVLTGGIAHSKKFTSMVGKRVAFLGPMEIIPGESEMRALYEGTMRVINGEEEVNAFEW